MSAEENIATIQRIIAEFNRGNLDFADEVFSQDLVFHTPNSQDSDLSGIKAILAKMHNGLPDWHLTIEDIFATEDKAAYRISMQGTWLGEMWGAPPNGKKFMLTFILIDHFADGKIVEEWEWLDFLGFRQQLGLIPDPEKANP
jgi:steroid delta-isomerase-like uncharacterized protein